MGFIYFTAAVLVIVIGIAILACYLDRRNEKTDKAERRRIAECTHPNGFLTVKIFGHPDLKECVDCGRIFELDGSEVDRESVNRLLDLTSDVFSGGGRKQVTLSLPYDIFKKLYLVSIQKQVTLDDMAKEMIDSYINVKNSER